jgi:hypothetical protein
MILIIFYVYLLRLGRFLAATLQVFVGSFDKTYLLICLVFVLLVKVNLNALVATFF